MQTWPIALVLLLAGERAAIDSRSWRITSNKEGGYRVFFPGKTEKGAREVFFGTKKRLVEEEFAIDAKGVGYLVVYYDYSADEMEKAKPEGILKESRASALRGDLFAKPKEVRDIALGKYRGLAFSVRFTERGVEKEAHVRIYLVRNRAYALSVLIVGDRRPTRYEIRRFFDSFQVLSTEEGKGHDKN